MNDQITTSIDAFLHYLGSVKQYSDHTIQAYTHDLYLLTVYVEEQGLSYRELTHAEVRRFVSQLSKQGYAHKSMNRIISGIKSFYRYEMKYCSLDRDPFAHIRSMTRDRTLPTVLTREEVSTLINAPGDDFVGVRDRAIFHTFYVTGCRLSELLSMNKEDLQFPFKKILVHGKGSKDRYVFLTDHAIADLRIYLERQSTRAQKQHLSPEDQQAVFVNKMGKRLTPQGVHYIFHTYASTLGIEKNITPHTFRHTFATHILDSDAGIRVVQELLGHESISTTQIYAHVGTKRLKEVYTKNHPHGRSEP